jgi:hypothetical protein
VPEVVPCGWDDRGCGDRVPEKPSPSPSVLPVLSGRGGGGGGGRTLCEDMIGWVAQVSRLTVCVCVCVCVCFLLYILALQRMNESINQSIGCVVSRVRKRINPMNQETESYCPAFVPSIERMVW